MAQPMGIGKLGGSDLIFKRKFRWTLAIKAGKNMNVPKDYVKIAARPNLEIEELEINFLNAKTWIPGKGSWQTITVTYYDVAVLDNKDLWNWVATVYNFTDKDPVNNLNQASRRSDYAGTGTLTLYDGCGAALETWTLNDMWPQSINFGDLDYSSNDEVNIELTLRYSQVGYTSNCPNFPLSAVCTPCS